MSGFAFDAQAALHRAQKCRKHPTLPTLPTDHPPRGGKVGTVGKVGTGRVSNPEITAETEALALDLYEERAAIREEAGQPRHAAEAAALEEAARATGTDPCALKAAWAGDTQARALLGWLRASGGGSVWEAAEAMGWGTQGAWVAATRLRAAGLIEIDRNGNLRPGQSAEAIPGRQKERLPREPDQSAG